MPFVPLFDRTWLVEEGWSAQADAADFHSPADAPLLTEDAAMLLVDEHLRRAGSRTACTRGDIRHAFAYLTSPRIAQATWTDPTHTAIAITAPVAVEYQAYRSQAGGSGAGVGG